MDAHSNFAITTVAVAPIPATSGPSLIVGDIRHGWRVRQHGNVEDRQVSAIPFYPKNLFDVL